MAGPKFKIKANVGDLNKLFRELGAEGAAKLEKNLDKIVEANAISIVNEAKAGAPYKAGDLKRSIRLYGRPARLARTIGSNMPYAQRQEYEHSTNKGYFRKALWNGREPFRKEINDEIKKLGR